MCGLRKNGTLACWGEPKFAERIHEEQALTDAKFADVCSGNESCPVSRTALHFS
jgi:hypothetical protein